jgi:hypothetical protein
MNLPFSPAENRLGDSNGLPILSLRHWTGKSRIARFNRIRRQFISAQDVLGNLCAALFEQIQQISKIMNERETELAMNKDRLDRLLGGLLRVETEVLEANPGAAFLACSRLLRARRSHSLASSGG